MTVKSKDQTIQSGKDCEWSDDLNPGRCQEMDSSERMEVNRPRAARYKIPDKTTDKPDEKPTNPGCDRVKAW